MARRLWRDNDEGLEMIIRKSGRIVGNLDEDTLVLTDVRSKKLQRLVDDWRKNGHSEHGAVPEEDEQEGALSDGMIHFPFTPEWIAVYRNRLLIEGFEVQRE